MNYATTSTPNRTIFQTFQRSERGQSTLEFAFAIVVLLTVTLGLIDFSRAVYTKSVIGAASQEGARAGIVNILADGTVDVAATESAVRNRLFGIDPDNAVIDVVQTSADVVDVTVTYSFQFVTPMVGVMMNTTRGGVLELVSQASMVTQ